MDEYHNCECGRPFDYIDSTPVGNDVANVKDRYCPDCNKTFGSRNMRWYEIKDGVEYG